MRKSVLPPNSTIGGWSEKVSRLVIKNGAEAEKMGKNEPPNFVTAATLYRVYEQ